MSTATLDAAIQRSAVERVRLINAQRLRKMMQSVGVLSLKSLVQWVRALVRMILAPFRMIAGMLRLGGGARYSRCRRRSKWTVAGERVCLDDDRRSVDRRGSLC